MASVIGMKPLSEDLLKLNFEEATKEIVEFIRKTVEDAHAEGVVVGLSGGVDSSLAAALCVRALGKEKLLGIIMPTVFTLGNTGEDCL